MTSANPNLMTVLGWAEQFAAGQPCTDAESWRSSSSEAAWKWQQVRLAQELLDRGEARQATEIRADEIAELVDGPLDPATTLRLEADCWQSIGRLAEALSAYRFTKEPPVVTLSNALEQRLTSLNPQVLNGSTIDYSTILPPPLPQNKRAKHWQWPLIAAALLLVVMVSGAVGWLAAMRFRTDRPTESIAKDHSTHDGNAEQPKNTQANDDGPKSIAAAPKEQPDASPNRSNDAPPESSAPGSLQPAVVAVSPQGASPPQVAFPPVTPLPRPLPNAAPPELQFRSAIGLMLIDRGLRGTWRAVPERYTPQEPIRIASLAESWTRIEIPQVGALVWDGPAEAILTIWPDNQLDIHLLHGKIGIEEFARRASIRLETSAATWTMQSQEDGSALGVFDDPRTPALLMSRGLVAIEQLQVHADQLVRWQEGVPVFTDPNSVPGSATSIGGSAPLLGKRLDLAWLQMPDENRRKQSAALLGRLIDRLAAADDAGAEVKRLLTISRDARQAGILAQWNLSVTDEASRVGQLWSMLSDRRESVRRAGVKCLLELPPGSQRLTNIVRFISQKLDEPTTARFTQWVTSAWQSAPLSAAQAAELADHLGHSELPVRQVAVSLLELHTAPAFQQAGSQPPAYDAAGPTGRRGAAQAQWRQILQQLYTPSRAGAQGLIPSMLKPVQPAAPQNAAPGGT
jgi:hypothetical protein